MIDPAIEEAKFQKFCKNIHQLADDVLKIDDMDHKLLFLLKANWNEVHGYIRAVIGRSITTVDQRSIFLRPEFRDRLDNEIEFVTQTLNSLLKKLGKELAGQGSEFMMVAWLVNTGMFEDNLEGWIGCYKSFSDLSEDRLEELEKVALQNSTYLELYKSNAQNVLNIVGTLLQQIGQLLAKKEPSNQFPHNLKTLREVCDKLDALSQKDNLTDFANPDLKEPYKGSGGL